MLSASVAALRRGWIAHGEAGGSPRAVDPVQGTERRERLPRIAYFVNHYPKVSHTFIRREILALERAGFLIQRLAVRGSEDPLPDEEDAKERDRTHYLLRGGIHQLLLAPLAMLLRSPLQFLSALWLAVKSARHSDRTLAHHLIYLAEACCIVPLMKRFGAEHLHAHFGTNSADVVMLARALGGPPYSFTVHGPEEFFRPVGLREKIRRAAFVVGVSSFGRSQLCMFSDAADWPKIKVVHCGLEREFYSGVDAPPAPVARLICVGRLTCIKGQEQLIEALALLAAKGVYCELVLAGDGPERPKIEALTEKYGLRDRVRITGWISSQQVRVELLAARALVLPSFAEGLPVVIMEAMALRRPVLSTYVAGIPELVRPGETGWLFPAGSVQDLAQAMQECLSASPQTLRLMGEAALRRVTARHAIEHNGLAQLFCTAQPVRAVEAAARPTARPQSLPQALAQAHRASTQIP
jgi:glycosyltransferase involved in cell wall biosynthesis